MKLILSTSYGLNNKGYTNALANVDSNIMKGGPSIIRRPAFEKSNTELTNSLRAHFLTSQQSASLEAIPSGQKTSFDNAGNEVPQAPYSDWTTSEDQTLYVPTMDYTASGLAEERSQYDITVKLFYLPRESVSERCRHTKDAVALVLKELHVSSVDLLIVSFPGVSFDADDEDDEDDNDEDRIDADDFESMVTTWRTLEDLHSNGIVAQVGLAEFGSERLRKFLPRTNVRPSVDQINVRDCCVVPKSLILFAKQEKIELLTHNDCTNILPEGTVRELLGTGERGVGVLAGLGDSSNGLKGEIEPQWVVKYTAVVRDRGVIENKGYFAMAELNEP
ncbi:hypothetical protein MMC20_005588 [Loxospora ochrophaea]|nr:hypothetical protein [Loxospora ochrophaea]